MLNMESPQMYDAVQSLTHLDLKKQTPLQQTIIGQITLTAMSSGQAATNGNGGNSNGNNNTNGNGNNSNNSSINTSSSSNTSISSNGSNGSTVDNSGTVNNGTNVTNGQQHQQQQHHHQLHHQQHQHQQQQHHPNHNSNHHHHHQNGLVVKQHAMHQLQNAAAALNNNNTTSSLNGNGNVSVNNVNNVSNLLQKQMPHQYAHSEWDELTAQEISLDLQHLIDDQFRDQDTLGIFSDMVTSPAVLSATLPTNGNSMVSAAAKVLQHHQLQQQTLRTAQQQHNYGRSPLTYIPSTIHNSGSLPTYSNNSSDENSSIGSDTSTIKEEPIDPDYRRHLQETNSVTNNVTAATFMTNGIGSIGGVVAGNVASSGAGNANTGLVNGGIYNPYQNTNGSSNNSLGVAGGVNSSGSNGSGSVTGVGGGINGIVGGSVGAGVLNQGSNSFNASLNPANVLAHHSAVNLPHLAAGAHLLKHHSKQMQSQRKGSIKHIDKGTEEYRRRRERNNIAVRKSREKAKVRSREVEERVKTLLKEKETLLTQLHEVSNELHIHKQIYVQLMNHANPEVGRACRTFLNATSDQGI